MYEDWHRFNNQFRETEYERNARQKKKRLQKLKEEQELEHSAPIIVPVIV